MLAEFGTFALAVALGMSMLAVLPRFSAMVAPASAISALLVFTALVLLIVLRLDSDFTVANVAEHSNRTLPLLYKIAGTWGNHEGSMLLWALVVAGSGAMLAGKHPRAASVQAALLVGVLLFILVTSNPFARIFPPPAEGRMLNPLLQDMALAIHPPLLYLGYVGFSAVFSLAVAGLMAGRIDRDWARDVHPWIMGAWGFLTLGIALGSWWAYRELGWGGYWFWDPVENASLLPWLAGTALLHSNVVLKKRGSLGSWVALLAIVTFGMSLIGTFLVRSGAITSVHSFASDPARGIFILGYIAISVGGALWLYAARVGSIIPSPLLRPASREGMIVINNLFLLTACATVLLGTIYPLLAEALGGGGITVGAPYYHYTFLPLMAVPLFFAGVAPFMPWKKAGLRDAFHRAGPAWAVTLAVVAITLAIVTRELLLATLGFGLAGFLLSASVAWLLGGKWRDARNWPVFLGHGGAALLVIGITGSGLWASQVEMVMAPGDTVMMAGYEITLSSATPLVTPNYKAIRATLHVMREGKRAVVLSPETRRYAIRDTTTSEAAIYSTLFYDLYAVIGDAGDGNIGLRLYHKPAVGFLWGGALLIALAGMMSSVLAMRRRA